MSLIIHPDPVPLRVDESGEILVGGTRVMLATLISYHQKGMSPEAMARSFPSVSLADIFGALAYYLRHQAELDAWMVERDRELEEMRCKIEGAQGPALARLKAKMDAARVQRNVGHAAPAD